MCVYIYIYRFEPEPLWTPRHAASHRISIVSPLFFFLVLGETPGQRRFRRRHQCSSKVPVLSNSWLGSSPCAAPTKRVISRIPPRPEFPPARVSPHINRSIQTVDFYSAGRVATIDRFSDNCRIIGHRGANKHRHGSRWSKLIAACADWSGNFLSLELFQKIDPAVMDENGKGGKRRETDRAPRTFFFFLFLLFSPSRRGSLDAETRRKSGTSTSRKMPRTPRQRHNFRDFRDISLRDPVNHRQSFTRFRGIRNVERIPSASFFVSLSLFLALSAPGALLPRPPSLRVRLRERISRREEARSYVPRNSINERRINGTLRGNSLLD